MQLVDRVQKWPKYTFIATLVVFVLAGGLFLLSRHEVAQVTVKDRTFQASVARDKAAQVKGFAGQDRPADDVALLIAAETDEKQPVWMKDMNFSIDAIWLDGDRRVVHVETALSPDSYPRTYGPDQLTRYVVELPAGSSDARGLKKGEAVNLTIRRGF